MLTTFKTVLTKKESLAIDVFLFDFQLVEPKEINFTAGQYLILFCPKQDDGHMPRRLYSIASPSTIKNHFELVVEIIPNGIGSTYFNSMRLNEEVTFQGPAGLFTLRTTVRNKIMLATGTGIAPLRSILETELPKNSSQQFHLFFGMRKYADLYYVDKFIKMHQEYQNFRFTICLSREKTLQDIPTEYQSYIHLGRVNGGYEKAYTQNLNNYDYYLCGGREVVESLRQYLNTLSIPKEQIFFEKF